MFLLILHYLILFAELINRCLEAPNFGLIQATDFFHQLRYIAAQISEKDFFSLLHFMGHQYFGFINQLMNQLEIDLELRASL